MDQGGNWRLSPAFDVTYSHNPKGTWTNQHQMSINGKRNKFTLKDLVTVGESISLPRPIEIIHQVLDAVEKWPKFALEAGVNKNTIADISQNHRMDFR